MSIIEHHHSIPLKNPHSQHPVEGEWVSNIFITYRVGKCILPQHGFSLSKGFLRNKLGQLILNIFET